MRLILDSHSSIACGPETHFLVDMEESGRRHWHRLERFGQDRAYWDEKCRRLFDEVVSEYAASKGKRRWADKTPAYATHLPFVNSLFPEAQVIHMIRDARMVTASSLARWGPRVAWNAPVTWVHSVEKARQFGAGVPDTRYTEIRFESLVADPEGTLRPLFGWLGEDWEPRVLEYDTFDHDQSGRNTQVSDAARQRAGTAIDADRAQRPQTKMKPLLRARVERVAGRLNRELGYR